MNQSLRIVTGDEPESRPAADVAAAVAPLVAPSRVSPSGEFTIPAGASVGLAGVHKSFGPKRVLTGIDLQVTPNEFVALVGRSGCGKSTLLRLVAGLDRPTLGNVSVAGRPLAGVNSHARMMFQDARLLPWLRVGENVALGLRPEVAGDVHDALSHVQLADRAGDWPAVLSGGQRQRVALARALIGRPELLLLDEPLGSLDALTRIEMQTLIDDLWRERPCTAILVTHDIEEAVLLADRVLLMEHGTINLEFAVELPRPRVRTCEAFQALVRRVLERVLRREI